MHVHSRIQTHTNMNNSITHWWPLPSDLATVNTIKRVATSDRHGIQCRLEKGQEPPGPSFQTRQNQKIQGRCTCAREVHVCSPSVPNHLFNLMFEPVSTCCWSGHWIVEGVAGHSWDSYAGTGFIENWYCVFEGFCRFCRSRYVVARDYLRAPSLCFSLLVVYNFFFGCLVPHMHTCVRLYCPYWQRMQSSRMKHHPYNGRALVVLFLCAPRYRVFIPTSSLRLLPLCFPNKTVMNK